MAKLGPKDSVTLTPITWMYFINNSSTFDPKTLCLPILSGFQALHTKYIIFRAWRPWHQEMGKILPSVPAITRISRPGSATALPIL